MVFVSPPWVPKLPDIPDTVPLSQFMHDEKYGRVSYEDSKNPFTCGLSGRTYTLQEARNRFGFLARAIGKELGFRTNEGSEWDKVIAIYSFNAVDYLNVAYAIHELNGILTPVNAVYSAAELEYQLKSSGAKAIFTCLPLLENATKAAKAVGIPNKHIYIVELPKQFVKDGKSPSFKTVGQLIEEGKRQQPLEPVRWNKGQGARQAAFLCYSSGTSGLPKGVMISHKNVISNILQISTHESLARKIRGPGTKPLIDVALGLLPMSHIYGLVVVSLTTTYRGDEVIVLPKFELRSFLNAIQTYKISMMYLVPPIIIQLVKNAHLCKQYDLSSIYSLFTGAAPLGRETAADLQDLYPHWKIRQGYGLTETCTVVCSTSEHDIFFGTSGSLLPGCKAKILSADGVEITDYGQPGELVMQSPSVVLGYLNNDTANSETFLDDTDGGGRWMRTGDEAMITVSPAGNEHVTITERIKELIKVKGMQVAPAELEAHLLTHPHVADCAVISIPDDAAGEVPKAFVVKSNSVGIEDHDHIVVRDIKKHVEDHKSRHKWLKGGVEFIDIIPKSPSGKILRRLLRDRERAARKQKGAKL